ncbi:hypothetical protein [Jiulongibacter sp. NS-SX5]|uniref:hypothetical protein n=1 Tax=Jiulongibacter sp. NS-SX5 TaxID=3463854 RepID=UPI004057D9DA
MEFYAPKDRKLESGEEIDVVYKVNGENQLIPHIILFAENEYYGWSDTIAVLPGIIDKHLYKVEEYAETKTRFIQSDEFKGFNSNISNIDLARYVLPQYLTFNRELKLEVERRKPKN